jgi:hypothetical protein
VNKLSVVIIFTSVFLSGCAGMSNKYESAVNSYAGNIPTGYKTFYIIPENKNINRDDLSFSDYSKKLARVLSQNGMVESYDIKNTDFIILLGYAVGDPKQNVGSYSIPEWGQTGVASSNTYGTINSYGNYSATTTYTPTYGITGYENGVYTYTTYSRIVDVNAYDGRLYQTNGQAKNLWSTRIASVGESADLRSVYPYMIFAAKPYFGKSSGSVITISVKENDPQVAQINY